MKGTLKFFVIVAIVATIGFVLAGCEGPAGPQGVTGPQLPNLVVNIDVEGNTEIDLIRGDKVTLTALPIPYDDTVPTTLPTLIWELYDAASNELISLMENRPDAEPGHGFPLLSGNSVVVTGLAGGEANILVTALGSGANSVRSIITVRVDDVGQRIAALPDRVAALPPHVDGDPPEEFIIYTVVADEPLRPQLLCFGEERPITVIVRSRSDTLDTLRLDGTGAMFTLGCGVTLRLENITLQGTSTNTNALVVAGSGSNLIMGAGSTITGNINTLTPTVANAGNHGGGVRVGVNATFTMLAGGVISENTSSIGGGVFNQGTFNMENGEITGNTVTALSGSGGGGGVANWEEGIFHMIGGTISYNTSANGGGVLDFGDRFTMSGGVISNNTSSSVGGGISTLGTFNMNGGVVSTNRSNVQGGGVNNSRGIFNMRNNAIISGNISAFGGGVENRGSFTLYAGVISGNTASGQVDSAGGGVGNWQGTFNMRGGEIFGNTAEIGGGVDNWQGTLRISDGTIYGIDAAEGRENTANLTDIDGNSAGAALFTGPLITAAQYGEFENGTFVSQGNLTNVAPNNYTIRVEDGVLVRPDAIDAGVIPLGVFENFERSMRVSPEWFDGSR